MPKPHGFTVMLHSLVPLANLIESKREAFVSPCKGWMGPDWIPKSLGC